LKRFDLSINVFDLAAISLDINTQIKRIIHLYAFFIFLSGDGIKLKSGFLLKPVLNDKIKNNKRFFNEI
jgi:hypothetical protein